MHKKINKNQPVCPKTRAFYNDILKHFKICTQVFDFNIIYP